MHFTIATDAVEITKVADSPCVKAQKEDKDQVWGPDSIQTYSKDV